MAKKILLISVIGIIFKLIVWPCFVHHQTAAPKFVEALETEGVATLAAPANDSCAQPGTLNRSACQAREEEILATVVRLELLTCIFIDETSGFDMNETYAHATIKDGRYLVTHNHYDIPLGDTTPDNRSTMVTISKADGQAIFQLPLHELTLVIESAETLVFDVGEIGSQKLTEAGLHSANFKTWSLLNLQQGMEVAQLDWDGATAHIDWVSINGVFVEDGTPHLELDNFVRVGASGGPIFWHGYHVGNNWARQTDLNAAGQVVRAYSIGALNTPAVVES